ncbi:MAG TPA: hypothetical protein VHW44_01490 [Pseudonocardiaceae bacterium]|nr:hypothetical protein [Pseudonocardiaceae bacterium]
MLLGGVGGDAHFVGLTVLRHGLLRGGYQVIFLGAQNQVWDICAQAGSVDAVLVSNMDGHARYYLADLAAAQAEYGVRDRLWYLGGHPVLDDLASTVDELARYGFDRVFSRYVDLRTVLDLLATDLADRPPVRRPAPAPPGDRPQPAEPIDLHPGVAVLRDNVLSAWYTGEAARDQQRNTARLADRASLAAVQRESAAQGRLLIQPRTGVSGVKAQRRLFATLRDAGADVLSFQIDSLTRNNQYEEVERVLKEPRASELAGSLLNGFPAVNHGVEVMAGLTNEFRDIPFQVRHSTRDPRLLAELSFAAGISAFEGGAITYNLPYYRDYPPQHSIQQWRYVDELAGQYSRDHGIVIDREFFGVLTACLVPPCLAVVVNIFEALLAAQCGVKSVTLGYAEQGNRAQDLAAVRVLRSLAGQYLSAYGHADTAVNVVWHQYMGAFPAQPDKARQLLVGSTISAHRSGAVRLMLKTWVEALRIPDAEDNRDSLRFVRAVADRERTHPAVGLGEQDRLEQELLEAECRAILDHALAACDGDPGRAAATAVERGWLDIPFSPSRWNAGKVLPLRDATGAVRLAATGDLPLPAEVKAAHQDFVRHRPGYHGHQLEELIEQDIVTIARGRFDAWPLG